MEINVPIGKYLLTYFMYFEFQRRKETKQQVCSLVLQPNQRQITLRIVGCHFSSQLTATLNVCPIYLKLLVHVLQQYGQCSCDFEVNQTKIRGAVSWEGKWYPTSDLPLVKSLGKVHVRQQYYKYLLLNSPNHYRMVDKRVNYESFPLRKLRDIKGERFFTSQSYIPHSALTHFGRSQDLGDPFFDACPAAAIFCIHTPFALEK